MSMYKLAQDGAPCLLQHGSPQLAANHTLPPACRLLNGPPGHGIEGYLKKHILEDGLVVNNRIIVYKLQNTHLEPCHNYLDRKLFWVSFHTRFRASSCHLQS